MAAEFDEKKLPPPARASIDFTRDIKPIFENNCLKCHGEEKPKNNFRLTTREAALKGGKEGVDIVAGQSAKSPLLYYVARLVPDMEMPPSGRGSPLTPEQVGLLRAWIEQGALWESAAPAAGTELTVSPTVGWTKVHGDTAKFRELNWQPDGWNGGVTDFELKEKLGADSRLVTSGHLLVDDYKLSLSAEKTDLGFTRIGWSQFRKYYDDAGGFYPGFSPSLISLNRDLHTDVGRAWADIGLTLPGWPQMVLGYEYQYRDGTKSTLQWGPVVNGTETRNIFPAFKSTSEKVHILKFDLDYTLAGVRVTDNFRGEWYHLDTQRINDAQYTTGGAGTAFTIATDQQTYFQGANTLHLEKQLTDWWFASGGYLYSHLDSDASMDVRTAGAAFLDPLSPAPGWHGSGITLDRESHVFSVSSLLGPWQGLTLSLGTQNEWTRQHGLGSVGVNLAGPSDPFPALGEPLPVDMNLDQAIFSQNVGLRFTKIPFTTLFAEARLQEENVGQFEEDAGGLTGPFLRDTDSTSYLKDFRAGFDSSPWRRVSLGGHYRHYDKTTDYSTFKQAFGSPYEGYPGFIRSRDLLSQEVEGRLGLQLAPWLKSTFNYKWLANDYHTATDPVSGGIALGGDQLAGTYRAQLAGVNFTMTRWRRVFLSTALTYQHARTVTWANGSLSVVPYEGDIYSVLASGSYLLNDRTDLTATYSFSDANFAQHNAADGLPLGIDYQQHAVQVELKRRFGKGRTVGLQYRFYHYDEPTSGGFRDFDAHAVFATLAFRFP